LAGGAASRARAGLTLAAVDEDQDGVGNAQIQAVKWLKFVKKSAFKINKGLTNTVFN
jgi:hypothetical protein